MALDLTRVPATDPTAIYRYRDGLYAVDLITAAVVDLDLFSWLADRPSTAEDICRAFDLQPRPTDVLITLLVASGLLERDGPRLRLSNLSREHLTGALWNLSPYYASLRDRPVTRDFTRVLRTGRPAHWGGDRVGADWHAAMETEAFARPFTAAMDCRGVYLGQALAKHLDLAARRRVLDIGGGSGIYACSLVAHHPHLRATVFEQHPVARIAETLLSERGFADRVEVATGDFLHDPWPPDCDVHLLSNVLHDWDLPVVRQLLDTSFQTLAAGGLLVIHEAFINADKTGPLPVAEYSALLMHSTQGKCYATSEYAALLSEAGFGLVTYADTAADRGAMTATKPG
ncbi:MAG: methyltransferase [Vicinamibacterales bacterium]